MNIPQDLIAGDILLYSSPSIIDEAIEWKTGDDVAHVEIYAGDGESRASRNEIGVNLYPFRPEGLMYVRRLKGIYDIEAVESWFNTQAKGTPYGNGDILATMNIKNDLKGVDCSHYAACDVEVGDQPQFDPSYPKSKITPRDFKISLGSVTIWSRGQ